MLSVLAANLCSRAPMVTSHSTLSVATCLPASNPARITRAPISGTPVASTMTSRGSSVSSSASLIATDPPSSTARTRADAVVAPTALRPIEDRASLARSTCTSAMAATWTPGVRPSWAANPRPIWPAPTSPTRTGRPVVRSRSIRRSR